jgi:hypothetical protein
MRSAREQSILVVYLLLLALAAILVALHLLIFRGISGAELVPTLSADAEWGIVAVALYAVVFELGKESR